MKKLTLLATLAITAMLFTSCRNENKVDYKSFVGTWGVERIEYYNIDYAGNPIAASMTTFSYDYEDFNNGIHLVFREDQTGEMLDSAIDSLQVWNDETMEYEDSYIYCPDTVLVSTFSYSYDESKSALYMNMRYVYPYVYTRTFMVEVGDLKDDSFTYENEYGVDYMEKAYMRRVKDGAKKSASRSMTSQPRKKGSMFAY